MGTHVGLDDDKPNIEDNLSNLKASDHTGFNTKFMPPKNVVQVVEETKENKPSPAVTFNYDYDYGYDYNPDYYSYDSSSTYPYVGESKKNSSHWCCFFPSWRGNDKESQATEISDVPAERLVKRLETKIVEEKKEEDKIESNLVTNSGTASSSRDDEDDGSVGSGVFGEKLSEKDRQAVLARLRLARPNSASLNFDQIGSNDHTKHNAKTKSKIALLQTSPPVSTSSLSSTSSIPSL